MCFFVSQRYRLLTGHADNSFRPSRVEFKMKFCFTGEDVFTWPGIYNASSWCNRFYIFVFVFFTSKIFHRQQQKMVEISLEAIKTDDSTNRPFQYKFDRKCQSTTRTTHSKASKISSLKRPRYRRVSDAKTAKRLEILFCFFLFGFLSDMRPE